MALTVQEKIKIAQTYAPILYFHPEEQFVPIRPEIYLQRAALWESTPSSDDKKAWGKDLNVWPREATIPKNGISLDPNEDFEGTKDPDHDGVKEFYLGHKRHDSVFPYLQSNVEKELWLDSSGWSESQVVKEDSTNEHCNKEAALEKWQEQGFGGLFSGWYYAEVQESSDLDRLLISMQGLGLPVADMIRNLLGEIYVVWYYFLYPVHEEYLRRCEQVFEPGEQRRGDYEGDWNAIGVVIRQPARLPGDPHIPPDPLYVAYGVRLRGISKEVMPNLFKQGMVIRPFNEVSHLPGSLHPRVFVSKGYHNNYSQPGPKNPLEANFMGIPLEHIICEGTEAIDEAANDLKETLDDIGEVVKDIGVTIAKIAAGAEIGASFGGPFGAAIGAIGGALAGVFEGLATSNTDDIPSEEIRESLEQEQAPPDHVYGLILKPNDVTDPLLAPEPEHPENLESAIRIQTWLGTDADRLVDRSTQIWWPDDNGYNGLWVSVAKMIRTIAGAGFSFLISGEL